MTNDELNKYIKTYFTLFDFAGLDFDVEEIIEKIKTYIEKYNEEKSTTGSNN